MKSGLDFQLRDEALNYIENYLPFFRELAIEHVGYREFYNDGTSKAFCSNVKWYDINSPLDMSFHYLQELMNLKRSNHNYVIRSAYNTHNSFLQKLKQYDMCNSLIIYKKENDIIKLFSFIAEISNNKIMDSFINKRDQFKEITECYNEGLENIFQKKVYMNLNKPLLSQDAATYVFSDAPRMVTVDETKSVKDNKVNLLTAREKEYLSYLITGLSNKTIAYKLNITEKTVEYHFQNIKEKFKVRTRYQMIDFYKSVFKGINSI